MLCGKLKGTVAAETDGQMVGACWLSSVVCIEIRALPQPNSARSPSHEAQNWTVLWEDVDYLGLD